MATACSLAKKWVYNTNKYYMSERISYIQKELKNKVEITYTGLSKEQQRKVSTHIESIGFPLDNVKKVIYRPGKEGEENILGSFQPNEGTLTLYKSLDKLPPIAQHGTIVHELAHSVSPFDPKNEKFYGSKKAVEQSKKHAVEVAQASADSGKYLNGYQANLHQQLEAGEIDPMRFVEETRAIMMELRFNNPKHLQQVEKAQQKTLAKINKSNPNAQVNQDINITDGVDESIFALIPSLKSKGDIDRHVNNLKNNLVRQGQPILPNRNYSIAA